MKTWLEHHLRKKRHNTNLNRLKLSLGYRITNFSICHPKHHHIQRDPKPYKILWLKPTVPEAEVLHQIGFSTPDFFHSWQLTLFSKSAGIQQRSHKPCQWQMVHSAWEQHKALLKWILWLFILVTPKRICGSSVWFDQVTNKPHFQMSCWKLSSESLKIFYPIY